MAGDGNPRVRPGTRREIGWVNYGIAKASGFAVGGEPPRIFTTLGRHRGLFRGWLFFAGRLMPSGKLPRQDTELTILRVAHLTGSDYEWGHHERIGRQAGLSEEEIARVRSGPEAAGWSERQALILSAVDQLHRDRRIDDEVWARLARIYDEPELIELCMLTGHYEMLAMTLNSLEVVPDPAPSGKSRLRWLSRR